MPASSRSTASVVASTSACGAPLSRLPPYRSSLATAPRQLPVGRGGNCRGSTRSARAIRRQNLSQIRCACLLVSGTKLAACQSPDFCSVSFLRAAPCHALSDNGNLLRQIASYLCALRLSEGARNYPLGLANWGRNPLPVTLGYQIIAHYSS